MQNWQNIQTISNNPRIIDNEAFEIFLLIQSDPGINIKNIAEKMSRSTILVRSRIELLKEVGLIRPDQSVLVPYLGRRQQTEVEAIYNPYTLGMKRYHVFVQGIYNQQRLSELEIIASSHPYIHYQNVAFTNGGTVYLQFDLPPSGERYLEELFKLLNENFFTQFTIIPQNTKIESHFDFNKYQKDLNIWQLFNNAQSSLNSIKSDLEILWDVHIEKNSRLDLNTYKQIPELRYNFDTIDYKLLRELTVNDKLNISKLASFYEIDRSRISRRIKRLRSLATSGSNLVFNPQFFNINQAYLIRGECNNMEKLLSFIQMENIPFHSTITWEKNSFLLFIQCPHTFLYDISRLIWSITTKYSIDSLDLKNSQSYYFNHMNFENDTWVVDREYLIDMPIDIMEKITKKK